MFNGGPGCDDYLAPMAGMIDDLCRVIRFEPRGCGRSDWDGNYDIETLVADAEAVRREYGAERCIVAGHSFGPNAALAHALRYPSHVMGLIGSLAAAWSMTGRGVRSSTGHWRKLARTSEVSNSRQTQM